MKTIILLVAGGIAGFVTALIAYQFRDDTLVVTVVIGIAVWLFWNVTQWIITRLKL